VRGRGGPPAGRGEGVRGAPAAVGGGADVRLAEAVPAADRRPGEVGPVERGDGPAGDDPPDAPPPPPGRRRGRVPLPESGLTHPYGTVTERTPRPAGARRWCAGRGARPP